MKRVPDQFDPWSLSLYNDDFDNIEPKYNIRIAEQPQPGETAEHDPALLFAVHRLERAAVFATGACFYLDKHQGIAIATDEIELSAVAAAKIAIENLEAVPAKIARGQFLAACSEPQMLGARRQKAAAPPAQTSGDGSGRDHVHGVSGDAARCHSPCAG